VRDDGSRGGRSGRDRKNWQALWDDKPDPGWSWENKQPVRDPNAPVTLWQVDTETSIRDPRSDGNQAWSDCDVLAFTARNLGQVVALILTDPVSADVLRHRRGVRSVSPATDRRYRDDGSETVVTVSEGGTHWERGDA
jgi:hypothetical protein